MSFSFYTKMKLCEKVDTYIENNRGILILLKKKTFYEN